MHDFIYQNPRNYGSIVGVYQKKCIYVYIYIYVYLSSTLAPGSDGRLLSGGFLTLRVQNFGGRAGRLPKKKTDSPGPANVVAF